MNSNSDPTIILVDAYAQIYRAFYAVRGLTNSKGQPTNAIFGLAKFLNKLEKTHPTTHGAVVFDLGKTQFRLEIAPDYKANRPPMPEELKSQTPLIRDWIDAMGWPIVDKEGYEADDLIAAFAANFTDQQIRIVSADKDLAQLINKRVKMLVPDHKTKELKIRGPEEVLEKFGVGPELIIDYLALIGDSSDNIPGVQGIGPKTAAKLLNECGSIANMISSPERISNQKWRDKIVEASEILAKNKDLVTLRPDLPEGDWSNINSLAKKSPDWEKLLNMCEDLELKSLSTEIEKLSTGSSASIPSAKPDVEPEPEPQPYTPDLFGDF